jgi:hypothetical protein
MRGQWLAGHDLARLNVAGWLLALSSALLLFIGLLAVGYLTYVPKGITPAQWAACAGIFVLSLIWFRLGESALGRFGVKVYRDGPESPVVRDRDDFD